MCFALAATLWQRAALGLEGVSLRRPKSFVVLLTSWVWLLGLAAQIAGVVLQAAALDRGRVSIIQPLLVTTIVWALPLGYFLTHQVIGLREVLGAAIIVLGLVGYASFGDPAAGMDNAPGSDWAASIILIALACSALLLFANRGGLSARAAVLGTIAGILYGLSATLLKPVTENLHTEGLGGVLSDWEFWVMAAAGLVGFLVQQLSLATGELVPAVATVSVANPVISVLLGALVLQETLDKNPPWHAVVAIGSLGVAMFGAALISSARREEQESEAAIRAGGTLGSTSVSRPPRPAAPPSPCRSGATARSLSAEEPNSERRPPRGGRARPRRQSDTPGGPAREAPPASRGAAARPASTRHRTRGSR